MEKKKNTKKFSFSSANPFEQQDTLLPVSTANLVYGDVSVSSDTNNDERLRTSTTCSSAAGGVISADSEEEFWSILNNTTIYEIMSVSTKVIVLDTELKIKTAFFALSEFESRGALLWNSQSCTFEGMFTVTDFINTLIKFKENDFGDVTMIEEQRISMWRELCYGNSTKKLFSISPDSTVREAYNVLRENHIHRIPVVDPEKNDPLDIITYKRILSYFYHKTAKFTVPQILTKTLKELKIGTLQNVITISYKTSIKEALHLFVKHNISALPVVDDNGVLIDIYSKTDVINLAIDRNYVNLDANICNALLHRQLGFEGVLNCTLQDSFISVFKTIVKARVHRLVIVDSSVKVIGVLSLSDVLRFLLDSIVSI